MKVKAKMEWKYLEQLQEGYPLSSYPPIMGTHLQASTQRKGSRTQRTSITDIESKMQHSSR